MQVDERVLAHLQQDVAVAIIDLKDKQIERSLITALLLHRNGLAVREAS